MFKQHPLFEIMVPVALVALASMTIGLLVSTLARTTEQTTPVLVVLVMAQLVLCGGLFELDGQPVMEQIAWLFPTRWGLAAGASTVDLQKLIRLHDPLWNHSAGAWWRSILLLLAAVRGVHRRDAGGSAPVGAGPGVALPTATRSSLMRGKALR